MDRNLLLTLTCLKLPAELRRCRWYADNGYILFPEKLESCLDIDCLRLDHTFLENPHLNPSPNIKYPLRRAFLVP